MGASDEEVAREKLTHIKERLVPNYVDATSDLLPPHKRPFDRKRLTYVQ